MRIKEVNIVNFKGFQNETVTFNGNLTVVIGNNTAGKTTLLKALQVGLGAYLQSLKTLPGGTSYRRNFSSLDKFMRFDQELRDYVPEYREAQNNHPCRFSDNHIFGWALS